MGLGPPWGCAGGKGHASVPVTLGYRQSQMVPKQQERGQWGLDQKPVPTALSSHPQGRPRSPAGQSKMSWVRALGPKAAVCTQLLSASSMQALAQPCRSVPGLHPGCAHPSLWACPGARTHHAPVGDAQVLGLPWHAAAVHRSLLRGVPTMGTVGSTGQSLQGGGQAAERARLRSCRPSHPETPAHYLFSLPQEVSL